MQSQGGEDMRFDQPMERHQRESRSTYLIGERRGAKWHALTGETVCLPFEWLVLAILLEQQHRQEAGPRPATRYDVERCWRLRDLLAVPAREFLAHRLDDLPRARDHFQRLGHILAEPRQALTAAGRARTRCWNDHALARQVLGKRLSDGALALEGGNGGDLLGRGCQLVLGGVGLKAFSVASARSGDAAAKMLTRPLSPSSTTMTDADSTRLPGSPESTTASANSGTATCGRSLARHV